MMPATPLKFKPTLQAAYPQVHRLAAALSGSTATASSITRQVLSRSGILFHRWADSQEAQRWFLRYTVLCCREHQPQSSKNDPLFLAAANTEEQAMIVALRHLPVQQREAFLLCRGEHLDHRQCAAAMDCSSTAAVNHLKAAEESMRQIAMRGLDRFTAALPGIMQRLTPDAGTITLEINRAVRKRRRDVWFRRIVVRPIKWLLLITAIWAIWKWRHLVQ